MRIPIRLVLLCCLLLLGPPPGEILPSGVLREVLPKLGAGGARAAEFPRPSAAYSATMKMSVPSAKGDTELESKIFWSGSKERRETSVMGQTNVMIMDHEQDVLWILLGQQKMYIEQKGALNSTKRIGREQWRNADVTMKKVGKETLDGHATTKYEVSSGDPDTARSHGFAWLTKQNIPVRMEGTTEVGGRKNEFRIRYDNIKVGKQDPALFELPEGYKPFGLPSIQQLSEAQSAAEAEKGSAGAQTTAPLVDPSGKVSPEELERIKQEITERMEEFRRRMEQDMQQSGASNADPPAPGP